MSETSKPEPAPVPLPLSPVAHLEAKAVLLLLLMLLLVCGSALYVLYARGAFEATQQLVLVADDSEGVVVGMDLTFAGFPIGRVRRIELGDDGKAHIVVEVARKDAHWLRVSSVFTLVHGLLGNTNIRAYSGILTDPPLPDGIERQVLQGDAMADVPRMVSTAKELLENLAAMTAHDAALGASLAQLQMLTEKLNGPGGALGVLLGNEADRKKLLGSLERTADLLARLNGLIEHADAQVFGEGGVMPEARAAVGQLNAALTDARASLKKVEAVLQEAQAVGANVRVATADLGTLRAEVDANLRKLEGLMNDIQRKWPFARDTELKLP